MGTFRYLLLGGLGFAAGLGLSSAYAVTQLNLTGTYSVSEQYNSSTQGGPSVSGVLVAPDLTFPKLLNVGGSLPGVTFNLFTLSPHSTCAGGGCVGGSTTGTETDVITLSFSGLTIGGFTLPGFTEWGTFTAKYSGAELGCAAGDGVSPSSGETDCFVWNGASPTWNGSVMVSEPFGTGQVLDITFHNATDWNITPTVSLSVDPPGVPEPSTWAMMMLGFAGLGFAAYSGRGRRAAISIV